MLYAATQSRRPSPTSAQRAWGAQQVQPPTESQSCSVGQQSHPRKQTVPTAQQKRSSTSPQICPPPGHAQRQAPSGSNGGAQPGSAGQAQLPPRQTFGSPQPAPQAPQWLGSVARSTHRPPQQA